MPWNAHSCPVFSRIGEIGRMCGEWTAFFMETVKRYVYMAVAERRKCVILQGWASLGFRRLANGRIFAPSTLIHEPHDAARPLTVSETKN